MASISGANKIVLKGDFGQHEEGPLAAIASPGMNVVMTTAVDALNRQTRTPGATPVGGTAAGAAAGPITVVKEDPLSGRTINDAYASGENSFFFIPKKGDVIQVLVASGQTILKADGGFAIASGKWNGATVTINRVGQFLEGSGGALAADTLMRLRVD
jgi:hypothetical protein